jgi:hypothetical protein
MKKSTRASPVVAVLFILAALSACGPSDLSEPSVGDAPSDGTTGVASSELSAAVAADLTFIRQEEKLARDVYLTLFERWGAPSFSSIAQSEQQHMDVMRGLLATYGVADPVADAGRGVFVDPMLQGLYGELVTRGETSLTAALAVGADIEDLDLVDIETRLGSSPPADVVAAYQSLMKGSRNHLRSYVSQLSGAGASYSPTYLTTEAYAAIIASTHERGP